MTRHRGDGAAYTNLASPLTLPEGDGTVVGFEKRGRARMDESGSYKDKAEDSNLGKGLWITSPTKILLAEAERTYWFESIYDAMAYYQLDQKWGKELRKGVFVSIGGVSG